MNAQTAAIGRAIVGVGLLASRKIASAEEVRNRQAEKEPAEAKPKKAPRISAKMVDELLPAVRSWRDDHPEMRDDLKLQFVKLGVNSPDKELKDVIAQLPNKKAVDALTAWLNANE